MIVTSAGLPTRTQTNPRYARVVADDLDSMHADQLRRLGIHADTTITMEASIAEALHLAQGAEDARADIPANVTRAAIAEVVHYHVCDARERQLPYEVIDLPRCRLWLHVDPETCTSESHVQA